jgi:hypothetical protein
MRAIMKLSAKTLKMALLALVCMGYGSFIAYFFATQVKVPNLMFNPLPYHNFAMAIGAGVGLIGFAIAYAYFQWASKLGKADSFSFLYVLNAITGIVIGAASVALAHAFSVDFGLISSSIGVKIIDSGIAAFFGGGIGLLAAILINENI